MFVNIQDIVDRNPDTTIFDLVGRRGCGKTFGVKVVVLSRLIEADKKFLYVRRQKAEIRPFMLDTLFSDVWEKLPGLRDALGEKYGAEDPEIRAHGGFFWVCGGDKNKRIAPVGAYTCVSTAGTFKGFPHNDIESIFFDEVITDSGYYHGDHEPDEFSKILYTVARADVPVKIFLCGNPDQNIEMCPYFYGLHLDYESLSDNSMLYFNSSWRGQVKKNNILFIKLAGGDGGEYLNLSVAGVFGDVETSMAFSGETKHAEFKRIPEGILEDPDFFIACHLVTETAVITESGHHRAIHAYICGYPGKPIALLIYPHRIRTEAPTIICKYDDKDYALTADKMTTYRLTFPYYPSISDALRKIIIGHRIFSTDDFTAQTFINIYNDSLSKL